MSFWYLERGQPDSLAVVQELPRLNLTYAELAQHISEFRQLLEMNKITTKKCLGFVLCRNFIPSLVAYLAGLQSGDAVLLLNDTIEQSLLDHLIDLYKPDWLFTHSDRLFSSINYSIKHKQYNWGVFFLNGENNFSIHPETAVLLSTSGTTGSPKMVRLSYENITSNAVSIAQYLGITAIERPITTLPLSYSYGLSVVNSHLMVGATILLTESSIVSREFWNFFQDQAATSLAGVPYLYQMLYRLNLGKMTLPSLKTLTQAGGRLNQQLTQHFAQLSHDKNWRFFVMYGQTEATARISYVPSEKLIDKIGSIGQPIPGGKLSLHNETHELIYEGPNVMLGYAENRLDLAKGNELVGRLHTGDLAICDAEGYFYLTGRIKRFVKLFGNRVNLDEVEQKLESVLKDTVAVTGFDDLMQIYTLHESHSELVANTLMDFYNLHPTSFRLTVIDGIPYTPSGKKDYSALMQAK